MTIESLSPEHRVIAERSRHIVMCLIARTAFHKTLENPMPNIGYDESEQTS